MPDSFQEEVDDLLPLFPLPEHSLDEWMKDSKYNGVLVNEVHYSFFKPESKCNSLITRPLFSEELLDIYCFYMCKQDYSKWSGRSGFMPNHSKLECGMHMCILIC